VFPRIDLRSVGPPSTGISNALGAWYLAPDEISTFVVAQILQLHDASGEVTVVEGVTVDIVELDSPAPAGDDFVPPAAGSSELQEPEAPSSRHRGPITARPTITRWPPRSPNGTASRRSSRFSTTSAAGST